MTESAPPDPTASNADTPDPLATACELIGRFMYHFGQIEGALDEGIRKIFELEPDPAKVISATIDYSKKIGIVKSALILQASDSDRSELTKKGSVFSRAMTCNQWRLIVAHSPFVPHESGVKFDRSTTGAEGLNRVDPIWAQKDFTDKFDEMERVKTGLRELITKIAPYKPSLDFSDPRNSVFLGII